MTVVLRIVNALFDDLTRLAWILVAVVCAAALCIFTIAFTLHILWNVAIAGWMLGTFITI